MYFPHYLRSLFLAILKRFSGFILHLSLVMFIGYVQFKKRNTHVRLLQISNSKYLEVIHSFSLKAYKTCEQFSYLFLLLVSSNLKNG